MIFVQVERRECKAEIDRQDACEGWDSLTIERTNMCEVEKT